MTEQNLDRLAHDVRLLAVPTRIKFGLAIFALCLLVGTIFVGTLLFAFGAILRALGGM
jgi:uncharacterized membrane protein